MLFHSYFLLPAFYLTNRADSSIIYICVNLKNCQNVSVFAIIYARSACPELRAWYREMLAHFPAMNGPDAKTEVCDDEEDLRLTDYCIAKSAIYCAFAWSQADLAYKTVKSLATKNGVGFFNVSGSSGEILLPCGNEIK